jgi:cholesterol transport system auxiliary component
VIRGRTIGLGAILIAGLCLGGCITLFPKTAPIQLYSFGETPPPVSPADAGMAPFNLQRSATLFTRPAEADRILTTNGLEAAYIQDARWAAPAITLFDEAVARAFNAPGEPARVTPRGETGPTGTLLKLDVQTFEASYGPDKDAPPTIVVRVRGLLARNADRSVIDERSFEAKAPAEANRVGAIVHAFDAATADVVGQIVAWTDQKAVRTPPAG